MLRRFKVALLLLKHGSTSGFVASVYTRKRVLYASVFTTHYSSHRISKLDIHRNRCDRYDDHISRSLHQQGFQLTSLEIASQTYNIGTYVAE